MSKSVMEALFDGRVIPWERCTPYTPERKALEEKIENEKRYFIEKMSVDDCQRFEQLENLFTQAAVDDEVDNFSHGFALGMLLMAEVMAKKEAMLNA